MSTQPPVLLVVDDEPGILVLMRRFGERVGYEVVTCHSGQAAIETMKLRRVDVALVDLHMPEVNGLEVLRVIRETDPRCQAVLMTGYGSIESAVEAVKLGAADYLNKPLDFGRLERLLDSVKCQVQQRQQILEAEAELARRLEFCGMIGRSPIMQDLFGLIRRLAPHLRTALITGETGTGKELVARALHQVGPRAQQPFVVVDCSAVVHSTFESDLFGYPGGASPGEGEARRGLLAAADGGMVFLDEVSNLPARAQARLLRVLEFGELDGAGGLEKRQVDLQVVAATNRDLRAEVTAGRFRSDLFYRLNAIEIALPPLRTRREDIPYLTSAFVREFSVRLGKPIRGLTTAAEALLVNAPWDGNVRELRNVLERACLLVDGDFVTEREVETSMPPTARPQPAATAVVAESDEGRDLLSTVEREHIMRALSRTGGNKKAAARMLGVSRRALYRRLERLDLGATIARRKGRVQGENEEATA